MKIPSLTRRHFLRTSAVTLALPFLESFGFRAFAKLPSLPAPKRYCFIYTPNGFNQATFIPKTTGADWELTVALQPLAAVKRNVAVVTGLDRAFVPGTGVHAQCGSCWLTSSAPQETLDGGFPTNTTLDQVIARESGAETAFPSLELSCNDFTDAKETKYYESISWYAPGYAAGTEKNPRRVFRRLFGQAEEGPSRSVLDTVLADAKSLRARLGGADRQKLDEYLDSVRATERHIQFAERAARRVGKVPIPEPVGIPEQRGDYLRLMGDLMWLAFQNDLTRVATLVVDPERWDSPRMYHGLFEKPQNHHVLTHTKGDDARAKLTEIDRFHVAFFAQFVERLKSTREGNGTLLDSTTVAMGSGISDGDKHDYANLEVLMAGGALQSGHFHFNGQRPLADLWLTIAQDAGVKRERFADSSGPLRELRPSAGS